MNNMQVQLDKCLVDGSYIDYLNQAHKQHAKLYIEQNGKTYTVKPIWAKSDFLRFFEKNSNLIHKFSTKIQKNDLVSSNCEILEKIQIDNKKSLAEQILSCENIRPVIRNGILLSWEDDSLLKKIFNKLNAADPLKTTVAVNIKDYTKSSRLIKEAKQHIVNSIANESLDPNIKFEAAMHLIAIGEEVKISIVVDWARKLINQKQPYSRCCEYILFHRDFFTIRECHIAIEWVVNNPEDFQASFVDAIMQEYFKKRVNWQKAIHLPENTTLPKAELTEIAKCYLSIPISQDQVIEKIFHWMASKKVDIEKSFIETSYLSTEELLTLAKKVKGYFADFEIIEFFVKSKNKNFIKDYEKLFFENILGLKLEDQRIGCQFLLEHTESLEIGCKAANFLLRYFPTSQPEKTIDYIFTNWTHFKKQTLQDCVDLALQQEKPSYKAFQHIFENCPNDFDDKTKLRALSMAFKNNFYSRHWDPFITFFLAVDNDQTKLHKQFLDSLTKIKNLVSETIRKTLFEREYWENGDNFKADNGKYYLKIIKSLLTKNPDTFLSKFFANCFSQFRNANSFNIKYLDDLGHPLEASDSGGVTRQFLTDLSKSLSQLALEGKLKDIKFTTVEGGVMPIASTINPLGEHEARCYEALGKIMAMCVFSNSKYCLGQLFNPRVYQAIVSIPLKELFDSFIRAKDETLIAMYKALESDKKLIRYHNSNKDQMNNVDILHYAYTEEEERPKTLRDNPSIENIRNHFDTIKQALRQHILTLAKQDRRLPVIFKIAQGIHYHNNNQHDPSAKWLAAKEITTAIQGEFSKQLLKESINNQGSSQFTTWIYQWIDECTEGFCKKFILASTGSETLTQDMKIVLQNHPSTVKHFPTFHTCGKAVDLPPFPNYQIFKQKLEDGINFALEGDGFQTR